MVDPGGTGVPPTWESRIRQDRARAQFSKNNAEKWHARRVVLALDGALENKRVRVAREARERVERRTLSEAASRETVAAALDEWFESHKRGLQGATAVRYEGLLRNLQRVLPDISVREFTRRDAAKVLADFALRGGVKGRKQGSSSTRQARVILAGALDRCADHGIISANPLRGMRRLALPPTQERQPPSVEDVRRLLAMSAEIGDLAAPIALAVGCGLRRGEMLGLSWSALDLDGATLEVRASLEEVRASLRLKTPKTARSRRTVALPASVVETLRRHRLRQREWALACGSGFDREADLVNPGPDGRPWRPSTFTDRYAQFARSVGVRGTFHDLRHSHASALIANGMDARAVADRLGHASPAFTMSRYVHTATDADRRAAITFESILRGPEAASTNEAAS
jgi:integrase